MNYSAFILKNNYTAMSPSLLNSRFQITLVLVFLRTQYKQYLQILNIVSLSVTDHF